MNTFHPEEGGIELAPVQELKDMHVQIEAYLYFFNITNWLGRSVGRGCSFVPGHPDLK